MAVHCKYFTLDGIRVVPFGSKNAFMTFQSLVMQWYRFALVHLDFNMYSATMYERKKHLRQMLNDCKNTGSDALSANFIWGSRNWTTWNTSFQLKKFVHAICRRLLIPRPIESRFLLLLRIYVTGCTTFHISSIFATRLTDLLFTEYRKNGRTNSDRLSKSVRGKATLPLPAGLRMGNGC